MTKIISTFILVISLIIAFTTPVSASEQPCKEAALSATKTALANYGLVCPDGILDILNYIESAEPDLIYPSGTTGFQLAAGDWVFVNPDHTEMVVYGYTGRLNLGFLVDDSQSRNLYEVGLYYISLLRFK